MECVGRRLVVCEWTGHVCEICYLARTGCLMPEDRLVLRAVAIDAVR